MAEKTEIARRKNSKITSAADMLSSSHSTSVPQEVQKHVFKGTYELFVLCRSSNQIYLPNTFHRVAANQVVYTYMAPFNLIRAVLLFFLNNYTLMSISGAKWGSNVLSKDAFNMCRGTRIEPLIS